MTMIFITAVLYNPKYKSIIICVIEKNKYINAGAHNSNIYTILYPYKNYAFNYVYLV
uniref:Uncharacterized protein n=1 Tax=viral metagenome TaxID=1070528 RepID=A0A6C0H9V1_9ZZZZ